MPKNEVSLLVKVKDLYTKGLRAAGNGIKRLSAVGRKVGAGLAKGLAIGAAGLAALALGAKKLIGLYQNQVTQEAKLAAVLKATGFAAGKTASELKKDASALQELTGVGDDVIISTQAIVATFKNIRGDVFDRTTAAILDMSAVMRKSGQDAAQVEQQSIAIGKALNDPIKGLTALSRVGVTFTEQQKEQIRTLQEAGQIEQAQAIILAELETEFGGAAAAAHAADVGFKDITNTLGDMGEQVGKAITENESFKGVLDKVNTAIKEFADSGQIELWASRVKSALDKIAPVIGKVAGLFGKIKEGLGRAGAGIGSAVYAVVNRTGEGVLTAAKRGATSGYDTQQKQKELELSAIRAKKAAAEQAQIEKERAEMAAVRDKRSLAEIAKAEKIAALKEKQAKLEKDILQSKADQAKQDELNAKIGMQNAKAGAFANAAAEAQAEKARLEKMTIAEFVAERKGKRAREREVGDEAARIEGLKEKRGRGIKLSRKDREFMEAVAAKEAAFNKQIAKNAAALAGEAAAKAEAKRLADTAAQARNKQIQELANIRTMLKKNLEAT